MNLLNTHGLCTNGRKIYAMIYTIMLTIDLFVGIVILKVVKAKPNLLNGIPPVGHLILSCLNQARSWICYILSKIITGSSLSILHVLMVNWIIFILYWKLLRMVNSCRWSTNPAKSSSSMSPTSLFCRISYPMSLSSLLIAGMLKYYDLYIKY